METYFKAFVNWEQNKGARLLPLTEFAHNNIKNASTGHISFKFNYGYRFRMLFEDETDLRLRSRFVNKLAKELKELIEICCQNLFYAHEL